jgi:hypothetical protein
MTLIAWFVKAVARLVDCRFASVGYPSELSRLDAANAGPGMVMRANKTAWLESGLTDAQLKLAVQAWFPLLAG